MKKLAQLITAAVILNIGLFSTSALSSIITYDTRNITNYNVLPPVTSNPDYIAAWNAQISAISTQTLTSTANLSENLASFEHLSVSFSTPALANYGFQVAPDAGYGGAMYLDGTQIAYNKNDMWWGYNWANTSQIFTGSISSLIAGNHTLDVYWAEGCCAGGSAARFNINGGGYQTITNGNLANAVPEPTSIALLVSGLLGFGASCRKKNQA